MWCHYNVILGIPLKINVKQSWETVSPVLNTDNNWRRMSNCSIKSTGKIFSLTLFIINKFRSVHCQTGLAVFTVKQRYHLFWGHWVHLLLNKFNSVNCWTPNMRVFLKEYTNLFHEGIWNFFYFLKGERSWRIQAVPDSWRQ